MNRFGKRIVLIILLVVLAVIGVLLYQLEFDETEDASEPTVSLQEQAIDNNTVETYTDKDLARGIASKQTSFESKDPEYPDEEKTVYERNDQGSFTDELHPADLELWEIVEALAPTKSILNSIAEFEVYFDENDDTLASVESLDDTNDSWLYSINYIAVTNFDELVPTIIHEFAHILSLQNSETTVEAEQNNITQSCQRYLVAEGCLNEGSYLNGFFNMFWKDSGLYQEEDYSADEAAVIYENNLDDFVNDYAATNPVEDFAESFMTYTYKDLPKDATKTVNKKILYFDEFKEIRDYRNQSRQKITSW